MSLTPLDSSQQRTSHSAYSCAEPQVSSANPWSTLFQCPFLTVGSSRVKTKCYFCSVATRLGPGHSRDTKHSGVITSTPHHSTAPLEPPYPHVLPPASSPQWKHLRGKICGPAANYMIPLKLQLQLQGRVKARGESNGRGSLGPPLGVPGVGCKQNIFLPK